MDERKRKRILRQAIDTERLMGVDAVPIGDASPTGEAEASGEGPPAEASPPPARETARAPAPRPESVRGEPPEAKPAGLHHDPLFASAAPPSVPRLEKSVKLEVLGAMDRDEVSPCTKCGLHKGRIQTVFGEGDADAKLMFIGEGPGQTEDETGRPFVGRAGELLDKMIVAMGLSREKVYIANVVKCRPPNNRAPLPDEVDACWDYLRRQIETVQPVAIVTLGSPATKLILKTDQGITSLRGTWHTLQHIGTPDATRAIAVMPTFHPAYLLRAYTPENRKKVWSDLQKVMEYLKTRAE